MVGKTRIEALSDALFAIVMTLLILEIKAPVGVPPDQLAAELAKDAPSWVSFAITFLLASIFWVDQHRVLHALAKISKETLVLTFLFLALVSVLPFSTSLWGHYLRTSLATSIYFAVPLAIILVLTLQLEIAIHRKQIMPDTDWQRTRFRLGSMCLILTTATVSASFVDPRHVWIAPFAAILIVRTARLILKKTKTIEKRESVSRAL